MLIWKRPSFLGEGALKDVGTIRLAFSSSYNQFSGDHPFESNWISFERFETKGWGNMLCTDVDFFFWFLMK